MGGSWWGSVRVCEGVSHVCAHVHMYACTCVCVSDNVETNGNSLGKPISVIYGTRHSGTLMIIYPLLCNLLPKYKSQAIGSSSLSRFSYQA